MLCLSRKPGQSIVLQTSDGPIKIRVQYHHGNIRLCVTAPDAVRVDREEVAEARARSQNDGSD